MQLAGSQRIWSFIFFGFLAVYTAILMSELTHGLASLDGHAVVDVTRKLVKHHELEVSRPPGHPTTEVYVLPAIAWLVPHTLGIEFNQAAYLFVQGIVAMVALFLFYRLILRCGAEPWKAVLACVCLGLSSQFFFNAVDGEEFVFGILFLTLSFYLLINTPSAAPSYRRLFFAAFSFALATGCRPEIIFAAFLLPLWAVLHPNGGWKLAVVAIFAEAIAVILVWLPILFTGLHWPYTAGMGVRESLLGGAYRLIFQCFTVPVCALFCWILVCSVFQSRRGKAEEFPNNFLFLASLIIPLVFFGALFLHASTAAHVLPAVPFILLLAVRRSGPLLIVLTIATVIGFFVTIDIFKDRRLGAPRIVAGGYLQTVRQKPFYRLPYLERVLEQCGTSKTAIIADVWRWDVEYQLARGRLAAREEKLSDPGGAVPMFEVASAASRWSGSSAQTIRQRPMPQSSCLLLPRDAAIHPRIIEQISAGGYSLKMDALLYRTLFSRYNVVGPAPTEGRIGNVPIELFSINSNRM